MYCLVSIIMSIMAIYGGNNFHYLAAAAVLGYLAASGVAGYRNIRAVEATFSFPDEIYARSPFLLRVNVRCKARHPALLIKVRYGDACAFFPVIQPGETASRTIQAEMPARGLREMGEAELSSSYPFDFFTRYLPARHDGLVTVFPAPLAARRADADAWSDEGEGADSRSRPDADRDTMGVRPYTEGDPMRTIHWKSSAKTGRVNSRLYDDSAGSEARVIDLDALVSRGRETGLSVASYEISRSMKSGQPVGMSSRGTVWLPSEARSDKLSMLSVLALYE
jgi:uncharacterized protein (DUF58 family)